MSGGGKGRERLLESTNEESEYDLLPAGETGDDSFTIIPYQVLLIFVFSFFFFFSSFLISFSLNYVIFL